MKNLYKIKYFIITSLILLGCNLDEEVDPNRPTLSSVPVDATVPTLNNLVAGTLSNMLVNYSTYIDAVGIAGRDHYRFSPSDPRFVGELLTGNLDNNAFYTTNSYSDRYQTVRNANILIDAAANSPFIADSAVAGYTGIAQTVQAHELLLALNQQNENGIRVDVLDFENLGPFVSASEALAAISELLDDGLANLNNAGEGFLIDLEASTTSGFVGLSTPATFAQFNRALAARVYVYRELWQQALTAVSQSFQSSTVPLEFGAYYDFEQGAGLTANGLFLAPNTTGDIRLVHPEFLSDAEAGDLRLTRFTSQRDVPATNTTPAGTLTGTHDPIRYSSLNDNIPIITNEELTLILAEASIQTDDLPAGVAALNEIRDESGGLPDYSGPMTQDALIDEMLRQRRYSLYFLGHRWIDLRRYNRLDEIPIDRNGDAAYTSFPRPLQEVIAEGGN